MEEQKTVKEEQKTVKEDPRNQRFYCKVYRLNSQGEDKNNPIPVNDLGDHRHGRAFAIPGQETILSKVQINILKDAVVYHNIKVPEDSGVYDAPDPLRAAEKQFPKFKAMYDRHSGKIVLVKKEPQFSVEVLKPYKAKEV